VSHPRHRKVGNRGCAIVVVVRWPQNRFVDLPLKHGDLMTQDEDLGVLGAVGAGQQGEPAEHAEHHQVGES
jgi:hypothetical protein